MTANTKKVILFIVDGPTDEDALSPVMKKLFECEEIRFHVIHGDLTSDWLLDSTNAVKTVKEHIEYEMNRYGFKRSDLQRVIHLVDTDGAFIPDGCVVLGDAVKPRYEEERIVTKTPECIIDRNARKAQVLRRLYPAGTIWSIPYAVYYFSRNMEHVLHDIGRELTADEKMDCADRFADAYAGNRQAFVTFLSGSEFTVPGGYGESWRFISEGTHSLHRHCNLQLLFEARKEQCDRRKTLYPKK